MDRRVLATAAGIAAAALVALPAAAHAQVPLKRCGKTSRILCTRVVVPLDRTGAIPGSVSLNVHVVQPKTSTANGTILLLAGGPGQAAASFVDLVPELLGAAADTYQVVAFDQRGTGKSGFLRCPALRGGELDAAHAARCAQEIGPRRAAYTTAASVADIDAVRAALGVDKLTIVGVSYGTKVALDYASAHPANVDKLVLDSTLDPAQPDPFSLSTYAAIPRVVRNICAAQCPFTADAGADVDALAARLQRGALRGRWIDAHGRPHQGRVTGEDLLQLVAATDLNPFLSALLPGAVRGALDGDPTPLIVLTKSGSGLELLSGPDSNAILLATNCEDMAAVWPIGTPIDQREAHIAGALAALPPTAFGGFGAKVGNHASVPEICRAWPEAPIAQPPAASVDAPTLILSGELDLRTPTEVADGLAARLPKAQVVRVAGVGHSVLTADMDGCATANTAAFLAGQRVSDCAKTKRLATVLAPAPARLADVAPAPGLHGTVGRVASAAAQTAGDLILRAVTSPGDRSRSGTSYGGLRGGYISVSRRDPEVRLHRFSYVPGVELSGPLRKTMRVRGPGGIRGLVRLSRGGSRLVGTIAGHHVSVHIEDPIIGFLRQIAGEAAGARASAMLARWPILRESTISSSSAPPGSPAR